MSPNRTTRWCRGLVAGVLASTLALAAGAAPAADEIAGTDAALRAAARDSAARPRPPRLARAALLQAPAIGDVRLSPDGTRLASVHVVAQRVDVRVRRIGGDGDGLRALAGAKHAQIAWSGDGRRLWIADEHGLAAFDVARGTTSRVLKWDARRHQRFFAVDPRAPAFAIVHERVVPAGATRADAERHRYLRVDAAGKTAVLHDAARPLLDVLLDADGALAYSAGYDGAAYDIAIREHGPDAARDLRRCTGIEICRLVGAGASPGAVFVLSQHGEDTLSLQRRAPDGRWSTVARDPARRADADAVLWDAAHADWLAIRVPGGTPQWRGRDARTRARLAALARRLPGAALQLSASADGARWLVRATRATWPASRHYLYDPGADRLQPLFDARSPLTRALVAMHPVAWRARDGMTLRGWVLLPDGVRAGDAPLVAWLHGGPIGRVDDDYDPRLQLLANRGAVVFVPNFRGSTGHGRRYTQAIAGDVGDGDVLADVVAGLDHLLALGIGSRTRQAVMGHSFGGYGSLLAASHHPARFRVAFAAAPPTDYGWIKQWQAEHDHAGLRGDGPPLAVQFPRFGFAYTDAAWRRRMREQSPQAHAASLRAPLYVWAGTHDDHVPLPSITGYVADLRARRHPLAVMVDADAGHSPTDPLGREALVYLMELAAHRHLGTPLEPPSAALDARLAKTLRRDDAAGTVFAPPHGRIARKSPSS